MESSDREVVIRMTFAEAVALSDASFRDDHDSDALDRAQFKMLKVIDPEAVTPADAH